MDLNYRRASDSATEREGAQKRLRAALISQNSFYRSLANGTAQSAASAVEA